MNSRKTIVFIIDNDKQLYSQFNENSPIRFLRTFVRDAMRLDSFQLVYNGITIKNDTLKLRQVIANNDNSSQSKILFHVITKPEEKVFSNISCNTSIMNECIMCKHYRNELIELQNENTSLKEENAKLNDQLKKLNSIHETNDNDFKQLFQTYKELYQKEKTAKENLLQQMKRNNDYNNINNNNYNYITTTNNSIEINHINTISHIDISEMQTPRNEHFNFFNYSSTTPSNEGLIWHFVFPFLTHSELISVSLTTKFNYMNFLSYIYNYINIKQTQFNAIKNNCISKYNNSIKNGSHFQLSLFSNSALKVLNKSNNEIGLKLNKEFYNNKIVFEVFKMFYLFSRKLLEYNENNEKFSKGVVNELQKGVNGKSFGEYLKNEIENFDFSYRTINEVIGFRKQHGIDVLNNAEITKVCKLTGIIGFIVKDALVYCGIEKDVKMKNDEFVKERRNIYEENMKVNEDIKRYLEVKGRIEDMMKKCC